MSELTQKRRHLPSAITLTNLVVGCLAVKYALYHDLQVAGFWIIVGAIMDFFDGAMARKLGVSSKFGGELDSLADLITFGLAPAFICMTIMEVNGFDLLTADYFEQLVYASPLLMVVAAAIRLARFNIADEKGGDHFIGLPTLTSAMFWLSLGWWSYAHHEGWEFIENVWSISVSGVPLVESENVVMEIIDSVLSSNLTIFIFMVITSALMVSKFKMISFKSGWAVLKKRRSTWILLVGFIASISFFKELGIAIFVILYCMISLDRTNYHRSLKV